MTNMIYITVPGVPVPKARPRFTRGPGGRPRAYSDPESARYELRIKQAAWEHFQDGPLLRGLVVVVNVYVPMPESWSAKKKAATDGAPCLTKPDLDNYVKTLDALNGVAWKDDAQIFRIEATKVYSANPRMEILVEKI